MDTATKIKSFASNYARIVMHATPDAHNHKPLNGLLQKACTPVGQPVPVVADLSTGVDYLQLLAKMAGLADRAVRAEAKLAAIQKVLA